MARLGGTIYAYIHSYGSLGGTIYAYLHSYGSLGYGSLGGSGLLWVALGGSGLL